MIIDYLDPYVCSELLLGNDTYEPGYVPKQSLPIYSFSTYYINYDGEVGMINSSNSDGELTSMNYHDLRLSYFYNGGDYIALTSYPEEVTNANLSYLKESIDAQKEIEAGEPGEVYFQGGYRETFDDLGNNNYKITYWYGDLCPEGSRLEVLYFNDVEQTLRYETYINEEKPENLYYRFNKTYSLEDATYESALEKINIAVQLPKDKSIREFDFIDLGFTNYYGGGNASNFKIVSEVINKFKFPYLLSANSEFRVNQIYFGDWWDQYTSTLSRPQYWNDPLFYPVADRVHILVQPRFMIFNPSGEAESYESLAELMAKSELASIHLQRKDEEYNYHGFGIHIYSDEIDMTSGEIVTSYLSYSNLEFSEDLTINIDGELAVFKLYKGYVWNGDDTYGQTGQYLLIGEFTPGYQAVIIPEGESADIYEIAKLDFTVKDPAKVDDLDYLIMLAKETYP